MLKEDIIHFIERRERREEVKPEPKLVEEVKTEREGEMVRKVGMSEAEREMQVLASKSNSIPHLYFQERFDVTEASQIIASLKDTKISLLSILLKTFSVALKSYPRINSTYDASDPFSFKSHEQHHVGVPLFSPDGLAFRTIPNLQELNIK